MKNLMRNLFSLGLMAVLLLGSGASAAGARYDPAPAASRRRRGPNLLSAPELAPKTPTVMGFRTAANHEGEMS